MTTVRSVTFDLLRFPGDFTYVLALQEASAITMADAFAQVTRRPALVNLHSSAGLGNALGNLVAACSRRPDRYPWTTGSGRWPAPPASGP